MDEFFGSIVSWYNSIPLVTTIYACISTLFLILTWIPFFQFTLSHLCYSPSLAIQHFQLYRFFSSTFTHVGILHLLFNLLSWLSLAPILEKRQGSLLFLLITIFLQFIIDVIVTLISFLLDFIPFFHFNLSNQCSAGLSALLFCILVINLASIPNETVSFYGCFQIPKLWFPWFILILIQFLFPTASWIGHSSGIFTAYFYTNGFFDQIFFFLSSFTDRLQNASLCGNFSLAQIPKLCLGEYHSVYQENSSPSSTQIPSSPSSRWLLPYRFRDGNTSENDAGSSRVIPARGHVLGHSLNEAGAATNSEKPKDVSAKDTDKSMREKAAAAAEKRMQARGEASINSGDDMC